jgi:ankyrin repeat protein
LHWVLEIRDIALLERILTKKPNLLNSVDKFNQTTLFWAVTYKLPEIVELLFCKYKAQDIPNIRNCKVWNAITLTSFEYNDVKQKSDVFKIVEILKPVGVAIESVKLWIASRAGDLESVKEYLVKKIDPNSTIENLSNTTSLIQAISQGHLEIIKLLIQYKVDINKADINEVSPLYYSLGYTGQSVNPLIVKLLIENGSNVSQLMEDGDTPMHMAAYRANVGAIKLLYNHKVAIDVTNDQGKTPLWHC